MKKRFLSLLMTLVMMTSLMVSAAYASNSVKDPMSDPAYIGNAAVGGGASPSGNVLTIEGRDVHYKNMHFFGIIPPALNPIEVVKTTGVDEDGVEHCSADEPPVSGEVDPEFYSAQYVLIIEGRDVHYKNMHFFGIIPPALDSLEVVKTTGVDENGVVRCPADEPPVSGEVDPGFTPNNAH